MYDEHEYFFKFLIGGVAVILLCLMIICMPSLIKGCNSWDAANKEANVDTNWDKQKEIEDTLRSYMSSYNADKITYQTATNADTKEAAKIRANRTAAVYNEYYLKNAHIWKNNVPEDIKEELPYLE